MSALDSLLPIDKSSSASERVAARLMSLISSGNLAPGEKLPSENELCKAMHVSRPVVREALKGMVMMGLLVSRQGGGYHVTDLKLDRLMAPISFVLSLQDYNLESLFRAREVIDTGVAADAARYATEQEISALRDLVAAGDKLVDDPVGFRVVDAEFHALLAVAARNPFLEKVYNSLYSLAIERRRKASARPGVLAQSARDHAEIVDAIAAHDPEAAHKAMGWHVANIRRSTLAQS